MKCQNCGTEIPDNAKFCLECGKKTVFENNETLAINQKQKISKKKTIIFSSIAVICCITITITLFFTFFNDNKISVPNSPNEKTSLILGADIKLFDDCFKSFVEAYNTREEGDGGLLNETKELDSLYSQLKDIECFASTKEEIVSNLSNIIFITLMSNDLETQEYIQDSKGNYQTLAKAIPSDKQIEDTEKYIYEIIDKYYK